MKQKPENYGQVDESASLHEEHLERMIQYYDKTAASYNQWHCEPNNESSQS